MLVVGLTGGIASGKSLVAAQFETRGIRVIDADTLARDVVTPGSEGLQRVVARFGPDVLATDGTLDRARLRSLVFADEPARRALEEILHPGIRDLMAQRVDVARQSGEPYCITVVPLLVETGQHRTCDRTLVVDAPESVQVARLRARDGVSLADARRMLASQVRRQQRLSVADDVVANGDAVPPRIAIDCQVYALDAKYRLLANAPHAAH